MYVYMWESKHLYLSTWCSVTVHIPTYVDTRIYQHA